jgi:membrane protein implicated in regulation of membrane protease activity
MSEPTKEPANETAAGAAGCIAGLSLLAIIAVLVGGCWFFYSVLHLSGGTSFFISILLALGVAKFAESLLGIGKEGQGKSN